MTSGERGKPTSPPHPRLRATAEARRILAELTELARARYVQPISLAMLYSALGEKDRAFEWVQRAEREKDEWLLLLPIDPLMEPLRADPRVTELLRTLKLLRP